MRGAILKLFFRNDLLRLQSDYEHEIAELSLDHHFEIMQLREEFRAKLHALYQQSMAVTWSTVEAAQLAVHCEDHALPKWTADASRESLALTQRIMAEHNQAVKDSTF